MDMDQTAPSGLAYLVHDIDDAAVRRRMDLFAAEGFVVGLAGFHRRDRMPHAASDDRVISLGRTMDARMGQRLFAVLRHLLSPGVVGALCSGASVIVARNLEMLALAWRVRGKGQRVVYECLDIHRLMLGRGAKSRLLRWVERRLLACADLVLVSSPAFATHYFAQRQGRSDRILLVENKVPLAMRAASTADRKAGPELSGPELSGPKLTGQVAAGRTFVIGWFGMLRCRKTLEQLLRLVEQSRGRIEVVIAGMPSAAELPDLPGRLKGVRGVVYRGAYTPRQLPDLYAEVDFVWAIDYFEEGLNSQWLLPNRLYEGLAHGAVPIALRGVETGRWLARMGVGMLVDDPVAELGRFLDALDPQQYADMRAAIPALPEHALYQTASERAAIAAAIAGRAHG